MSALHICEKRQAIIDHNGPLLVTGGPGSGKTTVALLKARVRARSLAAGQEILFLSFSRSAVYQIVKKSQILLKTSERALVRVQTYHSFCLEILESHGKLLTGRPCKFIYPGEERLRRSDFEGDWDEEAARLASIEAHYCFDLLATGAASVLERSKAVRELYGGSHPLIIVDEFQDTDDDQWRMVQILASVSDVFCLADPEQRIFDYRPNVNPLRIDQLRNALSPAEFDLGGENLRSPAAGILSFADAVLKRQALPTTDDVKVVTYRGKDFPTMVHAAVVFTFSELNRRGVSDPTVAVLCRSNPFLAELSGILREKHTIKKTHLSPVAHDVAWDAELSAAAGVIVASIMEWQTSAEQLNKTLTLIAHYYRLKNAEHSSNAAAEAHKKYLEAAAAVAKGAEPKYKIGKLVSLAFGAGVAMNGEPVTDWIRARKLLQNMSLDDVFRDASMVRLFGARDTLATELGELWLAGGSYEGAADVVRNVLDRERFLSVDRPPRGCMLMSIHKSKGKEFDGVVLVEGMHKSPFFDTMREQPPYDRSRRLLRVGLTRARTLVTLVRPANAPKLVT